MTSPYLFGCSYIHAYIHLRFKHTVLGTHTSAIWAVCLGLEVKKVLLDVMREKRV